MDYIWAKTCCLATIIDIRKATVSRDNNIFFILTLQILHILNKRGIICWLVSFGGTVAAEVSDFSKNVELHLFKWSRVGNSLSNWQSLQLSMSGYLIVPQRTNSRGSQWGVLCLKCLSVGGMTELHSSWKSFFPKMFRHSKDKYTEAWYHMFIYTLKQQQSTDLSFQQLLAPHNEDSDSEQKVDPL